jgi:uncharacterized protein
MIKLAKNYNKKIMIILFSSSLAIGSCQKEPENIKFDTSNQKDASKTQFKKQGEVYFQDSLRALVKKIDVEIADGDNERHLGLMYRESMNEDQGMLFMFPSEEPQSFYMKNTVLPLDIIYVSSKKQIVKIYKNAVPYSETSLPSLKPCQYVVEVNAGFTDKFKIKEGSYIDWRRN